MGKKMAEILVDLIEGKDAERVTQIPMSLVIRESA
jgi:DNA-binding LacI/PurR family transcriptional regulator